MCGDIIAIHQKDATIKSIRLSKKDKTKNSIISCWRFLSNSLVACGLFETRLGALAVDFLVEDVALCERGSSLRR
jgi:hypothetical protein